MRAVAVIAILAGCLAYGFAHAEVSGSGPSNRPATYRGSLELGSEGEDPCTFAITLDAVLFELHTLQGKYRVVRIQVSNRSSKSVVLSNRADRIKVRLRNDREVDAIINMQQADPAVWDKLDSDARKALAYPKSISAGDEVAVGRQSQMSFFAFLPADVADPPVWFEFIIDSVHKSVRIEPPPATTA